MGEVVPLRTAKAALDHSDPASVEEYAAAVEALEVHEDCGPECSTRIRAAVVVRTSN